MLIKRRACENCGKERKSSDIKNIFSGLLYIVTLKEGVFSGARPFIKKTDSGALHNARNLTEVNNRIFAKPDAAY